MMDPGDALPFRLTFVSSHFENWKDLIEEEPSPDEVAPRIAAVGGAGGWILQTYLFLRRRGYAVEIAGSAPPDGVCLFHIDDLGIRSCPANAFVVVIRPDRPRSVLGDMQIVQNRRLVQSDRDLFVPYWPQPGLLPRDPSRGNRVERLGFVGRMRNLAERFQSPEFQKRLREIGVEFVVREDRWWDYRDLDVVLGVRDGKLTFLNAKPASKLVNAWMAGCPALVGEEPGFEDLRHSSLDYVTVDSTESVVSAIETLKSDGELFSKMLENGLARALEFHSDRTTDRWIAMLEGPVREAYEVWAAESRPRHYARYLYRCLRSRFPVEEYVR